MRKAVAVFTAVFMIVLSAGIVSPVATQSQTDQLDESIRKASNYLNKNLTKGNKLVILNVQSDYPALSEYIIDELIANTVNDKIFKIVDRKQLDAIRSELSFQMSGEVDDKSAQEAGRILGAQTIISGGITKIGNMYRLVVRALSVQSAEIEGQFNQKIPSSSTIEALTRSTATGYGSGSQAVVTPVASKPASIATTPATVTSKSSTTTTRNDFETIYFDYDKTDLKTESIYSLGKAANTMRSYPGLRVMVEGHAYERGTSAYNVGLGEGRAKAVREYLINSGIDGRRIETTSYGKERPANPNCDGSEECNSKNRRVEWKIVAK